MRIETYKNQNIETWPSYYKLRRGLEWGIVEAFRSRTAAYLISGVPLLEQPIQNLVNTFLVKTESWHLFTVTEYVELIFNSKEFLTVLMFPDQAFTPIKKYVDSKYNNPPDDEAQGRYDEIIKISCPAFGENLSAFFEVHIREQNGFNLIDTFPRFTEEQAASLIQKFFLDKEGN